MIKSYGISETGLVRKVNEDCIGMGETYFLLADGMGGYEGGQVASTLAVRTAGEALAAMAPSAYSEDRVRGAFLAANRAVLSKKLGAEELSLMGTTLVAAAVGGGTLYWGHVGDSRLYLYENGRLTQVTKDHSFVMALVEEGKISKEEMRVHPRKNEITRAVGIAPVLSVDTGTIRLPRSALLLLCSDGLSAALDDGKIQEILETCGEDEEGLRECAAELLHEVYEAGAPDNTSVILVRYDADEL